MSVKTTVTSTEAVRRLRDGNEKYLAAATPLGDVSPERRVRTYREGQSPYAVIITCSDSRVIPESIFSAGIGELFVVRSAGNTIGAGELGSVEYALSHLGCKLVVVMGHTCCGAVDAAMHHGGEEGYIKPITDEISRAIGGESDSERACALNVENSVSVLREKLGPREAVSVLGAMYHIDDGRVEFLSDAV